MSKRIDVSPALFAARQKLIFDLIQGYTKTQIVYVFAQLGIADLLKDADLPLDELSVQLNIEAARLRCFLLAAEALELCKRSEDEQYCLTALGKYLISDGRGSVRELAIASGTESYQVWGEFLYSVQTGNQAFARVFGKDLFEYVAQNSQLAERFHDRLLPDRVRLSAKVILAAYSFDALSCIVDVGGGHGALISTILDAHPHLTGILFDRKDTIEGAEKQLTASGMASRCRPVAGDFFACVPSGGDLYLLSKVIHNWDDERSIRILRNCRQAMEGSGKLLIIENIMPEKEDYPFPITWHNLSMLVLTGGQERTAAQYQSLLEAADLQLLRVISTNTTVAIIEAIPQFSRDVQ